MTLQNSRQRDINRKAWCVYRLVRANRDAEAERALNAFGSDSVGVANALIAEEYFLTGGIVRCLLFGVLPVIVVAILCSNRDAGAGIDIGIMASIVCAVFALACCIAGAMISTVMELFRVQYLPRRSDNHPARRAGKIGRRFLTNPEANTKDLLGGLLTAVGHISRHEQQERDAIDIALARVLSNASVESMLALSREQRDTLHYRFVAIADLVDSMSSRRIPMSYAGDCLAPDSSALLGVAILNAYEGLTITSNLYSQIYRIRRVSAIDCTYLPLEWQQFVAAAKRTLPIMRRSVKNSDGRNVLLRGSDSGLGDKGELLRVQGRDVEVEAQELVRASVGDIRDTPK